MLRDINSLIKQACIKYCDANGATYNVNANVNEIMFTTLTQYVLPSKVMSLNDLILAACNQYIGVSTNEDINSRLKDAALNFLDFNGTPGTYSVDDSVNDLGALALGVYVDLI